MDNNNSFTILTESAISIDNICNTYSKNKSTQVYKIYKIYMIYKINNT